MRSNQWYDNIRGRDRDRDRDEFFGRLGGGRLGNPFERDDFPPGYRVFTESS